MKTIFELIVVFGGMVFMGFIYNLQLPKKDKMVLSIVFSILAIALILLIIDKPFYYWFK